MPRFLTRLYLAVLLVLTWPASAATELKFWHAMEGEPAAAMQRLIDRFNASQPTYRVVASYHGEDTLASGMAAYRAGQAPHLLQLDEAAAADMMAERAYKPLYQLAAQSRMPLDRENYFPQAAALYSDSSGRLIALPFRSATPVLYYNRDAFRKAGLDPDKPPATWYELQPVLLALQAAEIDCPYTTSWPSWVHMENVSAWHNFPVASANNGFGTARPELLFNSHLMIRHVSLLSAWLKSELFRYAGRGDEAQARFARGECAVLTESSVAHANIIRNAGFSVGVAPLPHYDDFKGAPYNTLAGGGALWAMAGKKASEYAGVARFMQFLASPESATEWHRSTGYPPVTRTAHASLQKSGYYQSHPEMEIAVKQLRGSVMDKSANFARGVRLRQFAKIRAILDEELEAVWKGIKAPKSALDDAVARGNSLLNAFRAGRPGAMPARR